MVYARRRSPYAARRRNGGSGRAPAQRVLRGPNLRSIIASEPQRWGICDFEISNNARLTTSPILTAIYATLDERITKRT